MNSLAQERQTRLARALEAERIDALVVAGNPWRCDYIRWAIDYTPTEGLAIALIERGGRTRLVVALPVEAERARGELPGIEVSWAPSPIHAMEALLEPLAKARVALAPASALPYRLAAGRTESIEPTTALLDRLMMKKGPAELDALRRAAALADDGYAVFRKAARVGRTEYEVVADVEGYFRSRGCPENFMILGSGGVEMRGMHPPLEKRLAAGELVTTELTPAVEGYYAQICRTLVLGAPTAPQLRALAVYRDAMEAGIAAVRPGATAADVARAENDVFRRHGLGDYVTSEYTRVRGHGLGLYADSRPQLLEDVNVTLETDMTLIVHPNTYHPEIGYFVLGDAVRVTATGCEVLTRTPRELFAMFAEGGVTHA